MAGNKYQKGWVVQWQGQTIGGFHDDEEDAAETLRKARGLKRRSQLELAAPWKAPQQTSRFVGVCFHKRFQWFSVYDVSTGAIYSTAREAAAARAEAAGLPTLAKRRITAKELIKRSSFVRRVNMPVRGKIRLWSMLSSRRQCSQQSVHTRCSASS